jgi:hypothetical protein
MEAASGVGLKWTVARNAYTVVVAEARPDR